MMRSKNQKIDLLKKVWLFSACSDKELKHIASLADQVEVEEGAVLTKEGKLGVDFFVIAGGKAKVSIRNRRVANLGPGDFFGEMALLDQGPRAATVTAETPMSLLVLGARNFTELLDSTPSVSRKILKGVAERLRKIEKAPTKFVH
jgi:CRP/FNR family cyclic AMP-dependent transcriptional regulator